MSGYGRGMSGRVECDDWNIWWNRKRTRGKLKLRLNECTESHDLETEHAVRSLMRAFHQMVSRDAFYAHVYS